MNKTFLIASIIAAIILMTSIDISAQKSPLKFGDISIDNLKKKYSSLDSTAGAEIILDYGYTTFDHNFQIVFEYHGRVKIFNETEFDRGNIEIAYANNDRIERLKAVTYNLEDGKIVESEVLKKEMFDEKVDSYTKIKKIGLENVKKGSIIEWTYRVNYGGWNSLNPWYFQSSIPCLHSEYVVALPQYFSYKKIMTGALNLTDYKQTSKTDNFQGTIFNTNIETYIMKNVPAFIEEPYMPSKADLISNIKFILDYYSIPGQIVKQVLPPSYRALSKSLAESEYFGKKLEKARFMRDEIPTIIGNEKDSLEQIKRIYAFIRDNFEVDYDVESDNLRKIFDLKKGYPIDINMLLIATLNEAGFNASAVKLSTRKNGKLHPAYAIPSEFNYTVCHVKLGKREFLLDGSIKDLPFNMLSKQCLNGKGMLVSSNDFDWVNLEPKAISRKLITAKLTLNEDGTIVGDVNLTHTGYEALEFRSENKENIDDYKKSFEKNKSSWIVDNHEVRSLENVEENLNEIISFEADSYAETAGDLIYLTPIFYNQITENPFNKEERKYPIYFGAPSEMLISYMITIPDGYEIDELPKPTAIGLPNNGGLFMYNVQLMGNSLSVASKLQIKRMDFDMSEYYSLKEFYAQIVEKHAEQIVLKKKI